MRFEPLLVDLALGRQWPDANYLIGGMPQSPYPLEPGDHHIAHGVKTAHDGSKIAIVELKLFNGPIYFMAAAKLV